MAVFKKVFRENFKKYIMQLNYDNNRRFVAGG